MVCIRVDNPTEEVGTDLLLELFPLSTLENRHVILSVHYLTKWVKVWAIPAGKSVGVDPFLSTIFLCAIVSVRKLLPTDDNVLSWNWPRGSWDLALPFEFFAYNSSVDSTGSSPFYPLYGRKATFPIHVQVGINPNSLAAQENSDLPLDKRPLERLKEARHTITILMDIVNRKQKAMDPTKFIFCVLVHTATSNRHLRISPHFHEMRIKPSNWTKHVRVSS